MSAAIGEGGAVTPVRRDAQRNRALLVQAARQVFAERGLTASLDDIAEAAGVGVGTAYRHFANKQQLAAEVLAEATRHIAVDAEQALAIADPWEALVAFFEATAARQAVDRGLYQALTGHGNAGDKERIWPQVVRSVTVLFDRAKSVGVVRADADPTDVAVMFAMMGAAFELSTTRTPDLWRRYLSLLLDGLRAVERPPLPASAPGVVREAVAAGKQHRRPP